MQRKKQPDTVHKLDSEDYENIYLRLQQRIWRVVLGMFGATSIIAFITFFSVIDSNAEKQIKKTVESKDFQQILISTSMSRLTELEERLARTEAALKQATQQAAKLAELPISIDRNSITFTDNTGEAIQIVFGFTRIGKTTFQNSFQSPPSIILNPTGLEGVSTNSYYAVDVTNESFYIPAQTDHLLFRYVAIGKATYTPVIPVNRASSP